MADLSPITGHKRRRVDDNDGGFTQHDKFWFKDGNIILRCAQTGFRVHQSLLTIHSTIFRDMFDVATPGDDLSEGVPVVQLSDDPIKIARFLGYFYFHDEIPNDIESVLDFFEISSKYDIPLIRDICLGNLRRGFPDTLASFQEAYTFRDEELRMDLNGALRCLSLASAQNLRLLLPSIHLTCVEHYVYDLATDGVRVDALLRSLDLPASLQTDLTLWTHELLSEKRTKLDKHIHEFLQDSDRNDNYHCAQALGIAFLSYTTQAFEEHEYLRHENDLDIFAPEAFAAGLAKNAEAICDDCKQVWIDKEKEGRGEIWDKLPSYFSLGTWEELRAKGNQSSPTQDATTTTD